MAGFNLETLIAGAKKAVEIGGIALAKAPEFVAMYQEATRLIANTDDQEVAKAAYADLMAQNDEGFARLDAKLEAAKKR
jgi:hypothetical protein